MSLVAPSGWVVYSRPGCTLCVEFIAELAELLGERAHDVQVIDIDGDDELIRRYFERIPVLEVDGRLVCQYRLDNDRVREFLARDS